MSWNRTPKGTTPKDATTTSLEANVRPVAPALGITKTAKVGSLQSTAVRAEPGQDITYTVTVTNDGSPAYDVPVTDCVPAGIVVDRASLAEDGGTLTTDADCAGGRISWPAATIGTRQTVVHTYVATLAEDASLDGDALENTATTGQYAAVPGGVRYPGKSTSATVTPSFPEVAVTKSNDTAGGLSYVGQPSDFSVTFRNTGSAAKRTTAQDVLPANWSYVAGSATVSRDGAAPSTGPEPTVDGRTLTWSDLGALGQDSTLVLRYRAVPQVGATVTPGAGVGTAHVNHVTATAASASGATGSKDGPYVTYPGGGDDATASATIGAADLAITKKATTAKVVAGATTPKTWVVTVTNRGPDAAHGTTVVDAPEDLPKGASLAFSSADGSWKCTPTGDTWSCVNGAVVQAGDSFPELDVALTLPADARLGSTTNTATIHQGPGQTFDPVGSDDSDSSPVEVVAQADLHTVKTGPASVRAGEAVSWQIAVTNERNATTGSTSDARGTVTVRDTVPDSVRDVTVTAADGSGWDCRVDGQEVTCERDGLTSGVTAAGITVSGTVRSDVVGGTEITNRATAKASRSTDPEPSNDEGSAVSTATDDTTLLIDKQFSGELVAGSDAAWTITVENVGPADARSVVVHDTLESGTALVDGTYAADGWTCTGTTEVTCALDGTLPAGAKTTITLPVTTPSSLGTALHNTASVHWTNHPSGLEDPSAEATSAAAGQDVALRIDKTAAAASVDAGGTVAYTITVSNPEGPSDLPAGSGDTPSMTVTDVLPEGFAYVGLADASAAHWTATTKGGAVVFTSTDGLAKGASATPIDVTLRVPADHVAGPATNTAQVAPGTATGGSSHDDATVDVTTHADLSVAKTRTSAATADAGTDVTYDVTVHNDGPSDARDAVWTDTAPTGMTVTDVTTDDDGWEHPEDDVTTWTAAAFPAGATTVFHVTASIASGTPAGTLTNTAVVSSATSDPDGTDDRSTADVEVTTHASLGLTKTPVTAVGETTAVRTVTAGTDQVWLLQVHNDGPSDAQPSTVVTDDLPAGLSFRSASGTGWTCDGAATPDAVTCELSTTVVAGEDAPALWLTTAVASGYRPDALVNKARVTGSGTPSTPGTNGGAESPVTVERSANVAITIGHTAEAVIGKDLPETIQVRNDGASDADEVTVTYTLPKGLTYVSTEADPRWTVTKVTEHPDGSTTVTLVLDGPLVAGTLAPPVTVHQTVTADAYPGIEPSAMVTTTTPETTTADNHATDEVGVTPAPALSVTKTHTGALVRGKTVGYTVTVHNDGLTEDPGPVVVTDRLPEGLGFVSVNDARAADCTSGQTVSCTLTDPLPVGGEVAFQITVRVADDAPDRITNTATVTSPSTQGTSSSATALPTDPTKASDPAPVQGAPKDPELAFTGAAGLGIGALLALLAMAAGGVLLVLRRRRRA